MPVRVDAVAPVDAFATLADAVRQAKAGRPLTPVTVIVPTNTAGVMARRALGRLGGVAAVDMLTLYRLAELLGSPELVADGRSPVSTAVVDLAIRRVLADAPGSFETVAEHPSTVIALRDLHRELRLAGPDSVAALSASSPRGREAARVSQLTSRRLRADWYDEGDLLAQAELATARGLPPQLANTIVYLPQQLRGRELRLLHGLGRDGDVRVILGITGDAEADAELIAMANALDRGWSPPAHGDNTPPPPSTLVEVRSTTDADDEVRLAVRAVLDAARGGMPFGRMAILWAAERPYARLVEHHLDVAEIAWNGRPGTRLVERLVPRLVLDLLDVDRRGLRRRELFDLLADVPARRDGQPIHTAAWERVSRAAGVARDDHWKPRLGSYAARGRRRAEELGLESARSADDADDLATFVTELRATLGHPAATRTWREWAAWCGEQIERWIGRDALQNLDEAERTAWEQVERVLDRLRHLDAIGPPVSRREFRATFLAELEVAPPRQGRIGSGVATGALAGAAGLDVDLVVVVGAADGLLPPPPTPDPLVSDSDRAAAGLTTSDISAARVHRQFLSTLSLVRHVVVTYPRGDLRATITRVPTRWIDSDAPYALHHDSASHAAGLLNTVFPVSAAEHRLRGLSMLVAGGGDIAGAIADDNVLLRALRLRAGRRSDVLTVYDGDLTCVTVPRLDRPVSPTELETWMACPHQYFVRYLLDVSEIEEPGDEISITALDKGSALHVALDRFNQAILAGELPQPGSSGWTDVHIAALARIFDDVGADTERAGRTGRPAYWADERERMRADLLQWIQRDSNTVRDRGARVLSSERRFGHDGDVTITLPDGRSLALRGSIDRIDAAADGSYVVTDHKTGSSRKYAAISETDPTASGTRLQLPSYAAATLALIGQPDATVRAEYSFFGTGGYRRIGYAFTPAIWAEVARCLGHVVDGIESGLYPATPERPTWHLFVSCAYCEPDKLGTAERWGEWERKRRDPRLQRWFADPDADTVTSTGTAREGVPVDG